MFMRTVLSLLFCFCIGNVIYSQTNLAETNTVGQKYALTLMPAFFPTDKAGLQPGFQFKLANHWSLMTEVSIPLVTITKNNESKYERTHFLKIASELKYYPEKSVLGRFYSLQLGYSERNFTDKDSGWYHLVNANDWIGYRSLNIKSPVFFADLKWGREMVQWKKTFMDLFWGVGIRIIPTVYDTKGKYIAGQWSPPKDNFGWFIPSSSWKYDETLIRPHFAFGFRLGRKL